MKKCAVVAAVLFFALAGLGWSRGGRSVAETPLSAPSAGDPYSSPEAQRHFSCQPRHWASMVLVFE
jgi:hypothetical protein